MESWIESEFWRGGIYVGTQTAIILGFGIPGVYLSLRRRITNPESQRNKVVTVHRLNEPRGPGTYGILIEFGVKKLSTEGIYAEIRLNRHCSYNHLLRKGKKGFPQEPTTMGFVSQWDTNPVLEGDDVFRLSATNHSATPNTSIGFDFQSDEGEIWPMDILYFAIPDSSLEERPASEKIGRAYHGWKPPKS